MGKYVPGAKKEFIADTVSDVAKTSIDIAEGSVQNIGNLLIIYLRKKGTTQIVPTKRKKKN